MDDNEKKDEKVGKSTEHCTLCIRSKTIVGDSVVGQEKVCIAKQKDEDDVEGSHRKKKGFHADQSEGEVRDASWKC